jgi:hypothetical protein
MSPWLILTGATSELSDHARRVTCFTAMLYLLLGVKKHRISAVLAFNL